MNSDEFYTYEDRAYIKPTLSSGEQEKFIDNLRDIQKQNTAQVAEQTYNLGTQVPSNLGGLGGGESYFTSRYQTPQANEMAQTLKTASQAQQLQDAMSNYQSQLKNKYTQAQRAYNKRERARQRALQNAALKNNNILPFNIKDLLGKESTDKELEDNWVPALPGGTTSKLNGQIIYRRDSDGKQFRVDPKTYTIQGEVSGDGRKSQGFERFVEDTLGGAFDFVQGLFGFGK